MTLATCAMVTKPKIAPDVMREAFMLFASQTRSDRRIVSPPAMVFLRFDGQSVSLEDPYHNKKESELGQRACVETLMRSG